MITDSDINKIDDAIMANADRDAAQSWDNVKKHIKDTKELLLTIRKVFLSSPDPVIAYKTNNFIECEDKLNKYIRNMNDLVKLASFHVETLPPL